MTDEDVAMIAELTRQRTSAILSLWLWDRELREDMYGMSEHAERAISVLFAQISEINRTLAAIRKGERET